MAVIGWQTWLDHPWQVYVWLVRHVNQSQVEYSYQPIAELCISAS